MTKTNNVIIFLDIDGVMNSMCYQKKNEPVVVEENKAKILFEIIKETGAKVVLTSLRRVVEWEELCDLFEKFNITLYDKTPNISFNKAKEINKWLDEHEDVENFVVIDDKDMSECFNEKFVLTNPYYGLTKNKALKVINVLLEGQ